MATDAQYEPFLSQAPVERVLLKASAGGASYHEVTPMHGTITLGDGSQDVRGAIDLRQISIGVLPAKTARQTPRSTWRAPQGLRLPTAAR